MSEQSIFLAALDIADAAQRTAYVDSACAGDAVLRQQVLALLAAHERSGAFLNVPAVAQIEAGVSQPDDRTVEAPRGDENPNTLHFLQPSTKPGSLGRLGHYEVLQVLGQGGFGIVVKAFDDVLHRVVAIKVMSEQMAATSPPRQRFLREARSAAAVRHENVVAIHDIQPRPIPYLVMEYIPGQTLQEKLDETGPLQVAEVLRLGQQIANGLAAAHALGLVHRDIKPSNILLESGLEQRVKITDFGLARAADDASLTQSGVIAGTPMYMSPEQAAGEHIDHRADLFSLGSVLYVMCSGRPPFRASTTMGVLKRVAEDTPRPIREIIPEVPEWLVAIISKLHAKKPEERFQTAKEVADLLARCQLDPQQGVSAQPLANMTQLTPSARLSEQVQAEVGHFAIDAEQEVRRQREALTLAMNDHDMESVKSFIHSSYIGKTKYGYASSYQELINYAAWLTAGGRGYHEVVQIEQLIVDGDTARLTARHICSITSLCWWMTRRGTTRMAETWRKLDGRWQLVEQQELEVVSAKLGPNDRAKRWLMRASIVAACALTVLAIAAGVRFWPPGSFNGNPATKPVVDAGTKDGQVIDLIPLARPDPALGAWKREGDTLVCTPRGDNGYQKLPIPFELPREYELEAVFERLAGNDVIAFHMAAFGSTFFVDFDSFPWMGGWSGLGKIEGKEIWQNGTGIHGAQINFGKQYTFRCTVRTSGIVARLDDKLLFNYTGGFDKLAPMEKFPGVRGEYLNIVAHGTVGCKVHRLRLTPLAPEDKTNTPPAVTPFVVLVGKGQPERSFPTLKDAVDKATSGDTIEIRGNGPFQPGPLSLDKALTLRAGAGYRPVLVHTKDGALLWTTAPLVLEGLEFHSFDNKNKGQGKEGRWGLIGGYAAPVRIAHCRIVVAGELSAIWTWKSTLLEVKHSEVFSGDCAVDCGVTDRARLVIQNCCLGRAPTLALCENSKDIGKLAHDAEVELIDNTFVSDQKVWVDRFFQDPVDPGKDDFRSVRFKAVGNVFQSRRRFGVVEHWDGERPFRPDALANWYRAHVTWEARDNLFAIGQDFLAFTARFSDPAQEGPAKTSKDWQAFWKVEKGPGIEGTPRFAGGDLLERLKKEPLTLTAADFRLENGSPGQGAGPDGKDLGADVDRVGPGAAYEKWQKTPEYEEWRKKTEELVGR